MYICIYKTYTTNPWDGTRAVPDTSNLITLKEDLLTERVKEL